MKITSKHDKAAKVAYDKVFSLIVDDEMNSGDLLRIYYSQGLPELSYFLFSIAHSNKVDNMEKINYPSLSKELLRKII